MPGVPGLDGSDQKQISSLGFGDQAETPGDMQKEDKDNVREDWSPVLDKGVALGMEGEARLEKIHRGPFQWSLSWVLGSKLLGFREERGSREKHRVRTPFRNRVH